MSHDRFETCRETYLALIWRPCPIPRIHLTERAIAALPAPDSSGKQVLYWDTGLKGLGVLVSGTSPSKSYVVQRGKRITFSPVAEMTLIAA